MALRLAKEAVFGLGLRCGTPMVGAFGESSNVLRSMASRGYATVMDGFKYAKSHEYAKVDGDVATVGISDFAQSELGDVVYVELPEVGAEVTKGETFGVVESVKAASDVYSPVSGEVLEVNQALVDEPAKVNSEPFTGGWIMKVKLSKSGELGELLDSGAYKAFVDAGGH